MFAAEPNLKDSLTPRDIISGVELSTPVLVCMPKYVLHVRVFTVGMWLGKLDLCCWMKSGYWIASYFISRPGSQCVHSQERYRRIFELNIQLLTFFFFFLIFSWSFCNLMQINRNRKKKNISGLSLGYCYLLTWNTFWQDVNSKLWYKQPPVRVSRSIRHVRFH